MAPRDFLIVAVFSTFYPFTYSFEIRNTLLPRGEYKGLHFSCQQPCLESTISVIGLYCKC